MLGEADVVGTFGASCRTYGLRRRPYVLTGLRPESYRGPDEGT